MIEAKETKRQRFDRLTAEYRRLIDNHCPVTNPIPKENIELAGKIQDELDELAWNGLNDEEVTK